MKKLIMLCLLSFFFLYGSAFGSFNFIDNGDGTVTDVRKGLVWLKNANPCGIKTWYDAGTYCSSLASGQAGLTDGSTAGQWRLPSIAELKGIGTDPPATWETGYPSVTWTIPGAPFTVVQSGPYWSVTSYPYIPNWAWAVDLNGGYVFCNGKGGGYHVWPVRGTVTITTTTTMPISTTSTIITSSSTSSSTTTIADWFIDNNNGTVTDTRTGLIWLKNASPYKAEWSFAWNFCFGLRSGQQGLSDGSVMGQWRLPGGGELVGIGTGPSGAWTMPGAPFTNVQPDFYWGNSNISGLAFSLDMTNGYTQLRSTTWEFYVWPVRNPTTSTTIAITTSTTIFTTTTTTTSPTIIELASFEAISGGSRVTLTWETESEIENAGFNLYRSEAENGNYIKINNSLIPAIGSSTQGASYEFVDSTVQNRKTYYYRLEEIDLGGVSTMHGPVKATPRWIYEAGK